MSNSLMDLVNKATSSGNGEAVSPIEDTKQLEEKESVIPTAATLSEEETQTFRAKIIMLESLFGDVDGLQQCVRTVCHDLQANPNLEGIMVDKDWNTIYMAMRDSLGGAKVAKEGRKKGPRKGKSIDLALDKALDELPDFEI